MDSLTATFVDKMVENDKNKHISVLDQSALNQTDDASSSIVKRYNLDTSKVMTREEEAKLGLAASTSPTIVKIEKTLL